MAQFNLNGKVAIITGSSRGIGKAISDLRAALLVNDPGPCDRLQPLSERPS